MHVLAGLLVATETGCRTIVDRDGRERRDVRAPYVCLTTGG